MRRFQAFREIQKPAEKPSYATGRLSRGGAEVPVTRLAYRDFQKAILDF